MKTPHCQKGFTLIELLVVLGVIMIITLIVTFGKTHYERSLILTNLAYDVALAIREAQVYGVNVRQGIAANSFDQGYGVHFTVPNSSTFTLFVDTNNNRFYDGTAERVRDYTIKNNNSISALCVVPTSNSAICNSVSPNPLDITFRRPDPDACFNGTGFGVANAKLTSACVSNPATANSGAKITVSAPDGRTKTIRVSSIGQITVQ